jgi:uncharacterized damage-inducible protein DinB
MKIMQLSDFHRLLAYDAWANAETLASLRAAAAPARSLKFMAHIVGVEWLWLGRLGGPKNAIAVWPELDLPECEAHLALLKSAWDEFLRGLTAPGLGATVSYVNSKGERWTNTVADVLTQVIFHSTYHRGQIATDMRAAGYTPAYTDFIEAVRRGYVGRD